MNRTDFPSSETQIAEDTRSASPTIALYEPSPTASFFHRGRVLLLAFLLLLVIVFLEWRSQLDFSLGVFYVFPILICATVFNRWQILLAAILCAWIRGYFTTEVSSVESWLRFDMAVLAYSGIGLLVVEMSRNRRNILASYARLKLEKELRYRAEEQLRILVESSPAAIVTVNSNAEVLAANRAAHELFGFDAPDTLIGKCIADHVPVFAGALRVGSNTGPLRTSASSWAKGSDGILFPVATWFSTYGEGENRRLAGILVDTSEEVRDRERENFRHFLDYNRLLAGAVSHEIRNMCSAIRVVTSNLSRRQDMSTDADFQALTSLIDNLSRIASFELRNGKEQAASWISVNRVLEELRVVIEPDWLDLNGEVHLELLDIDLQVYADPHALLQIFLNLAQNSLRAVQQHLNPTLTIRLTKNDSQAIISFIDSGPGLADASILFHPFRPDADGSGLGLYISRTLARSFGGDLLHIPTSSGCQFDVILPASEPLD